MEMSEYHNLGYDVNAYYYTNQQQAEAYSDGDEMDQDQSDYNSDSHSDSIGETNAAANGDDADSDIDIDEDEEFEFDDPGYNDAAAAIPDDKDLLQRVPADQPPKPPHLGVFDTILDWGKNNSRHILETWQSSGGWECWAQSELAEVFHALREVECYVDPLKPNGRKPKPRAADLGLIPEHDAVFQYPYLEDKRTTIIELKCQSYRNHANLENAVQKDLVKIRSSDFKGEWTDGGLWVYAVSLSMMPSGDSSMVNLGMQRYDNRSGVPFALWWSVKYIHGP